MAQQFDGPVKINGELIVSSVVIGDPEIGDQPDALLVQVLGRMNVGGFFAAGRGAFVSGGVTMSEITQGAGDQILITGGLGITEHLNVNGDISVLGDVKLLGGGDVAEQFQVVGDLPVEPGCVVALAGADQVRVSDTPYDRRVAGVVSGAGNYRPALVLDSQRDGGRQPLALTGKVWCKVDADCAPVAVGDLLTTSPTPGHAMCATDPERAFGAVIGKALDSLQSGRDLIPVLVALQ